MNRKMLIHIFNVLLMASSVGFATKAIAQPVKPPVGEAEPIEENKVEENKGEENKSNAGGQPKTRTQEEEIRDAMKGAGAYRPPTDPEEARKDAEEVLRQGSGGPVIRPVREELDRGGNNPAIEAYQGRSAAYAGIIEALERDIEDTKPGWLARTFGSEAENAERGAKVHELEQQRSWAEQQMNEANEAAKKISDELPQVKAFMNRLKIQ